MSYQSTGQTTSPLGHMLSSVSKSFSRLFRKRRAHERECSESADPDAPVAKKTAVAAEERVASLDNTRQVIDLTDQGDNGPTNNDNDERIVSVHDQQLNSLRCLKPGSMLTDEVINMWADYVSNKCDSRRNGVIVLSTYFFAALTKGWKLHLGRFCYEKARVWTKDLLALKFAGIRKILIPVHIPDKIHWVLVAVCLKGYRCTARGIQSVVRVRRQFHHFFVLC